MNAAQGATTSSAATLVRGFDKTMQRRFNVHRWLINNIKEGSWEEKSTRSSHNKLNFSPMI